MKQAIVYIITTLDLGGAQKVCLELFNGCNRSDRPTFLITGGSGLLADTIKGNDRVFIIPDLIRSLSVTTIFTEIKAFFTVFFILRRLKKQFSGLIIHTHSSKAGIIGRWAGWAAGVKNIIHTVHGFAFHEHQPASVRLLYKAAERVTAITTSQFVCVSDEDIKIGQRLISSFKMRSFRIRPAIALPEDAFVKNADKKDKNLFIIGTISCFKPQKNLLDLLQAFKLAYAYNNNLRLELIGDGIERPLIEGFIKGNDLELVVTIHGWQHNVFNYLPTWNIFALTSLWEGLPCAIIEARYASLPILAYQTGGIHEVIRHGYNGFLYPQKKWQAMAADFIKLAANNTLYRQLSCAKDDFKAYSIHYMLAQHEAIYNPRLNLL